MKTADIQECAQALLNYYEPFKSPTMKGEAYILWENLQKAMEAYKSQNSDSKESQSSNAMSEEGISLLDECEYYLGKALWQVGKDAAMQRGFELSNRIHKFIAGASLNNNGSGMTKEDFFKLLGTDRNNAIANTIYDALKHNHYSIIPSQPPSGDKI